MLPPAGHWIWDKNEYKIPPCWFGGQCQAPVFGQKWWQSLKSLYINILAPASIFSSLILVLVVTGQLLPPAPGHFVTTTIKKLTFVNLNFIYSFTYPCTLLNAFIIINNMFCLHSSKEMALVGGNRTNVLLPPKIKLYNFYLK